MKHACARTLEEIPAHEDSKEPTETSSSDFESDFKKPLMVLKTRLQICSAIETAFAQREEAVLFQSSPNDAN